MQKAITEDYVTKKDLDRALDKAVEDMTQVIRDSFGLVSAKLETFATKKDLESLATKKDLFEQINEVKLEIKKVDRKIDIIEEKLDAADEVSDANIEVLQLRVKKLEGLASAHASL